MGTFVIILILVVGFVLVISLVGVNPQTKTDDQLRFLYAKSLKSGEIGRSDREKLEAEMKRRGLLGTESGPARPPPSESHSQQLQATQLRKHAHDAFKEGKNMGSAKWPGEDKKIYQHALTTVLLRRLQAEPGAPPLSQELIQTLNFEAIPFIQLEAAEGEDAICEYIVWREYPSLANEALIRKAIDTLKAKGFVDDVLKGASDDFIASLPWGKLLKETG